MTLETGRPSPLQNRVAPDGEIEAVPARGLLMGNRGGCFHDVAKRLGKRRWAGRRWIACLLAYNGWHRAVMTPGRYTELFFLDEAVALAAGHRPCAYCRREAFERFKAVWSGARSVEDMDRALQRARVVDGTRRKRTYRARLETLPKGAMVRLDGRPERAFLVLAGELRSWRFEGYGASEPRPPGLMVEVLTPEPVVDVLARGYRPCLHPSVADTALADRS